MNLAIEEVGTLRRTMYAESRQHPRIWMNLPVEYSVGQSDSRRMGYAANFSPGGVMLNIREKPAVGDVVELSIFVSLVLNMDSIKVHSEVVWVDNAAQQGRYLSGAKFVGVSDPDRKKLRGLFAELNVRQLLKVIP